MAISSAKVYPEGVHLTASGWRSDMSSASALMPSYERFTDPSNLRSRLRLAVSKRMRSSPLALGALASNLRADLACEYTDEYVG